MQPLHDSGHKKHLPSLKNSPAGQLVAAVTHFPSTLISVEVLHSVHLGFPVRSNLQFLQLRSVGQSLQVPPSVNCPSEQEVQAPATKLSVEFLQVKHKAFPSSPLQVAHLRAIGHSTHPFGVAN